MHIAVIGLGNFGEALVRRLFELGHTVTAMDADESKLSAVQDYADQALTADATNRTALEEAGVGLAQAAVVSLGDNLAASILVTLHLREMEVKTIITKAISTEHEKILKRVGASQVVFPEREAAARLATNMVNPNLLDYLALDEEFSVAEVAPPAEFVGKSLVELDLRRRFGVNVIAIKELVPENLSILIQPDYRIKDSDILVVLGKQADIQKIPSGS